MFFDSLLAVVLELLLISFAPNDVDEKLCCAAWVGKGDGEDESELEGDDDDPEEIDLVKDPGCKDSPIPPGLPFEGEADNT